eukprot:109437_1
MAQEKDDTALSKLRKKIETSANLISEIQRTEQKYESMVDQLLKLEIGIDEKLDIVNKDNNSGGNRGDPRFEYFLRNIQDEDVKNEIRTYPWGHTDGLDVLVLGKHKKVIMDLLQKNSKKWTGFDEEAMFNINITYDKPMREFIDKYDNCKTRLGLVYAHILDPTKLISEMKEGDFVHLIFYNKKYNAFIETKPVCSSVDKPKPEYGGFTAAGIIDGVVERTVSRKKNAIDKGNKLKTKREYPIIDFYGEAVKVQSYRSMTLYVATFSMASFPMIYGNHLVNYSEKQRKTAEQDYLNTHQLINGMDYDGYISKALNMDNVVAQNKKMNMIKNSQNARKTNYSMAMKKKRDNAKYNDRISECTICEYCISESECEEMVVTNPGIDTKEDAYSRISGYHWNSKHARLGKRYEYNAGYWHRSAACRDIASSLGITQRKAQENGKSDEWLRKHGIIDRGYTGFGDK